MKNSKLKFCPELPTNFATRALSVRLRSALPRQPAMAHALRVALVSLSTSVRALPPLASAILDYLLPRPPPPAPPALCLAGLSLDGVPAWAVHAALLEAEAGGAEEEGEEGGSSGSSSGSSSSGGSGLGGLLGRLLRPSGARSGGLLEALTSHVWMAVPKRKTSYSRKRQRQMNPLYARKNLLNFYPCPKCDKDFLKLRHHLCPCDQEKAKISGVKRVSGLVTGHFLFASLPLSHTHIHTHSLPATTPHSGHV